MSMMASIVCGILYSYYAVSKLPKGFPRLFAVLPVIVLYIALPWQLSSVHMRGITAFMFTWIGAFKLLMLCFEEGPLATPWARSNLFHFMAVAAFPIRVRQSRPGDNSYTKIFNSTTLIKVIVEGSLLLVVIYMYSFRSQIPNSLILVLYGVHIFLFLDVFLVSLAAMADACLGAELEPQFNRPYLSISLEDFWGRRWNLVVSNILRPSVYDPILYICWKTHKQSEKKNEKPPLWARAVAVLMTFVVSGLMHEVMFCCLIETKSPSWEVTAFFIFHGLCAAIEVALKRCSLSRYIKLPRFIAIPIIITFLCTTGIWLFFPPLIRSGADMKAIAEYELLINYFFLANVQN